MITGFIRIEGRPFGLIANNCMHMAGAIEAEGADKAARLMQICQAHNLPIISLCDTPGFMVGPEIEKRAQVRHVCRMFVIGSHLTVPYFTVILRRGYGLGVMAMAGAVMGYFGGRSRWYESFLLAAGALFLMKPGLITDLVGLVTVVFIFGFQKRRQLRQDGYAYIKP